MTKCPLCKSGFFFSSGLRNHLKNSECGIRAKKSSPKVIAKLIHDDDYSIGSAITVLSIFDEFSDHDYSSAIDDFSSDGGEFSGAGASGSFESDSGSSDSGSSDSGSSDSGSSDSSSSDSGSSDSSSSDSSSSPD